VVSQQPISVGDAGFKQFGPNATGLTNKEQTLRLEGTLSLFFCSLSFFSVKNYFLCLCLFFFRRFLRLWVAILWAFRFFPLGIFQKIF
jgi:hypothetical protein